MVKAPLWKESEIAIVAGGYGMNMNELRRKLPQRSEGAIEAVKAGIHYFHQGEDHGFLSRLAQNYLTRRRGSLTCPYCGNRF